MAGGSAIARASAIMASGTVVSRLLGLVKVVVTCRNDVKRVTIDPSVMADGDKEMLEDLVVAAMNDALRRAEATAAERMSSVTAGLPLPPGFKMPF